MSEILNRLRDQRVQVWTRMTGIPEAAKERSWTAEEQEQWDRATVELEAFDKRIATLEDAERRADERNETMQTHGEGKGRRKSDFLGFLRHEPGTPETTEVHFSPEYRDILTSGSGGNLVPTLFRDRLQEHLIDTARMIDGPLGPTIITGNSGADLQIPKSTVHPTAVIIGEGVLITESDPTFAQTVLGAFKYATAVQASREMLEDSGIDLEGYLARAFGRAVGNALGNHLVNGTGAGAQPSGIVPNATVGVTGGGGIAGAFTAENLIDLQFSVIEPYRRSSRWMMRSATLGAVRKLRDGSGGVGTGQFLFQPSLVAGTPGTLLGDPVVVDPFVPAVAATARSIVYGDFSAYAVRTVDGVVVARSDDFAFLNDLTTFKVVYRADGALVDLTGAVKVFVGGAAV